MTGTIASAQTNTTKYSAPSHVDDLEGHAQQAIGDALLLPPVGYYTYPDRLYYKRQKSQERTTVCQDESTQALRNEQKAKR